MTDLVTLQVLIYYESANSLIVATPEAWWTAEMIVTPAGERDCLEIAIVNPDEMMDIVLPTKGMHNDATPQSSNRIETEAANVRVQC